MIDIKIKDQILELNYQFKELIHQKRKDHQLKISYNHLI